MAEYLLLGLATWRISSLLVNEDGPWQLLARFRYLSGLRYDQESKPYATNVLSGLLKCVWCLSPWIGAAFTLGFWRWPSVTILLSLPFALSAMAVAWERLINGQS